MAASISGEEPTRVHLLGILNFTNFVATAGYSAVFILCLLQSCCVPTSSELTMGFAGVLAAQGRLSLAGVIVVGVLGEVVGAYIAWAVGRYAGRAVVDRFGRYILLTHRDIDRTEDWYDRHQRFGVFGSRLLPVIRNFVAVPAGIAEVPLGRFGLLTAAGSLLWDGAWAGIGYGVGAHWHAIAKAFGDVGYVLGVVAVGAVVLAATHRYRSYKEAVAGEGAARHAPPDSGSRLLAGTLTTLPTRPRRALVVRTRAGAGTVRWIASSSGRAPAHVSVDGTVVDGTVVGADRRIAPPAARPGGRTGPSDFPDSPIAAWEAAVAHGRRQSATRVEAPLWVGPAGPAPARARHAGPGRHRRSASSRTRWQLEPAGGRLPVVGRIVPAPAAAKVPEVIFAFWVVKILTTAGGEATSDYLRVYGNVKGGAIEVGLFVVGLLLQFGTRRYRAFAYWFFAFAIAIFGTGVADFLHLDVGIPYSGTTLLWAVILAAVFWCWQRSEGTLSIHSITTQRREAFYWATVFATFALGTALGDFTAISLHLGYLASGALFGVVILIPGLLWWQFGLNGIAAFWMSYVVTRPLGASFADYISKPHSLSGANYGDAPTAILFAVAVFVLVAYLAVARPDIQQPVDASAPGGRPRPSRGVAGTAEPGLDVE